MSLNPDAAGGHLGAPLMERLPDLGGEISWVAGVEDAFNRVKDGNGRLFMPDALEINHDLIPVFETVPGSNHGARGAQGVVCAKGSLVIGEVPHDLTAAFVDDDAGEWLVSRNGDAAAIKGWVFSGHTYSFF